MHTIARIAQTPIGDPEDPEWDDDDPEDDDAEDDDDDEEPLQLGMERRSRS